MTERLPGSPGSSSLDDELHLREHVAALWRRRYIIIAVTLVFGLAAFFISRSLPRQYEASARLMINLPKTGVQANPAPTAAVVAGYQAMIDSPLLAQRVIAELQLDKPPYNLTPWGLLNGVLRSQILGNTNIVVVYARMTDPDMAAKVATTVARMAVQLARELNQDETVVARDMIKSEVEASARRFAEAREKLEAFQNVAQIELLRKDVDAILNQRGELLKLLVEIQSEQARLSMAESQLKQKTRIESVRRSISSDPAMMEAARAGGADTANLLPVEMRNEFINPIYEDLEGQIAESRTKLAGLERQKNDLIDVRKLDGSKISQLTELYRKEGELNQLRTEFDLAKTAYLAVAQEYEQARLQVLSRGAQLQVLDEALAPDFPIFPRVRTNTMLGLVVGFVVAIIGVLAYQLFAAGRRDPALAGPG